MDRVELMSLAVSIADAGSLSAASRKLRMPVPTVSRKLSELEARLSTQLFQRSSRRLSLTDAGRSYVEACRRILEQVDDAEREASGEYRAPTGDMTVTSPWGVGHLHLLPLSCEFQKAYPDIGLRLLLTDRVVNPVENSIDVSIRIGPLSDSSLIATRVGSVRVIACASPDYLAARPATHACRSCSTRLHHDRRNRRSAQLGVHGGWTGNRRADPVKADGQHIGSRGRGRNHRLRHHPRDVLQDRGGAAVGRARSPA